MCEFYYLVEKSTKFIFQNYSLLFKLNLFQRKTRVNSIYFLDDCNIKSMFLQLVQSWLYMMRKPAPLPSR